MKTHARMIALWVAALSACSSPPPDARADKPEDTKPKAMATAPAPLAALDAPADPPPEPEPAQAAPARDTPPPDLPDEDGAADATPFPDEVTAFMVDRDGCDHFLGEEPYDEDRRAFLEENIRQLCSGTDARLADLRRRYSDNNDVMAALNGYDAVEGDAPGR